MSESMENKCSATFTFTDDWSGSKKAAVFTNMNGEFYAPIIDGKCDIPEEILNGGSYTVKVVGERNGRRIITNEIEVTK